MFKTTKHAATLITARGIKAEWIEFALQSPSRTEGDADDAALEHRLAPIAAFDFRVLRVIYRKGSVPAIVVTAFFDRKMKGKL